MIIIDSAATTPRLWRNGRGKTRELWAEPDGSDVRWKLSLADLDEDAPFSRFDGLDRIFTPVSGTGFELVVDGRPHAAEQNRPIHFPGEAETEVRRLTEPVQALNLMTARDRCSGTVHVRRLEGETTWRNDVRALVLVAGRLMLDHAELPPLGVAISTGAGLTGVAEDALVAEIHIFHSTATATG